MSHKETAKKFLTWLDQKVNEAMNYDVKYMKSDSFWML